MYKQSKNTDSNKAQYGEKSSGVSALQTYLNSKGANLKVDSMYGNLTKAAVAKYGLPSNTTTPTTPTTPETPIDTTRFKRTANPNDTAINDLRNKMIDYNNQSAPNLEEITRQKREMSQSLVDSIVAEYNRTLADQGVINSGMNDRVRALNVSSGLGGSDFATASAIGQETKNQKANDLIMKERDAKISAIYAGIDERASAQYKAEREAYVKSMGDNLTALKDLRDQDRKMAEESIKGFASAGVDISKLKSTDPETFNNLLKEYGGSEIDLETAWNASLPEDMKTKFETKIIQGAGGNAVAFRYGVNPRTGKVEQKQYDLGVKYNTLEGSKPVEMDGRLWSISTDANGNQIAKPLTDVSELTRSQTAKNWADASKTKTPTPTFSFNGSQKTKLVNANFKDSEITALQDDIRNFGITAVLGNTSLTEAQKTAIKDSLKGSDLAQQIAEYVNNPNGN